MKAIIYTPEEKQAIKEIRRLARNRYFREYRKKMSEAKKWGLNPRASKFVLSKTDEMEKCYKLSLWQ